MAYDMPALEQLSADTFRFLRRTPIEMIVDAAMMCGLKPQAIHLSGIRRLDHWLGMRHAQSEDNMVGPAITMRLVPNRFGATDAYKAPYLLSMVFESAPQGSVVVVDGAGDIDSGCYGGLAAQTAVRSGLAGVVVDGGVRDVGAVVPQPVPTFCKGVTPLAYLAFLEVQEVNGPVHCGGAHVQPGDITVGSDSGVIVLPRARVDKIVETCERSIVPLEEKIVEALDAGESWEQIYPEWYAPVWQAADSGHSAAD